MLTKQQLNNLRNSNILAEIDWHLAEFFSRLAKTRDNNFFLTVALLSRYQRSGHLCLELEALAAKPLSHILETPDEIATCPALKDWHNVLTASGLVGDPGEEKPLVLDQHHRLYLQRYWQYENELTQQILTRAQSDIKDIKLNKLQKYLENFFPNPKQLPDWQKLAAITALHKRLLIISGGPGTGKTTTVANILALLLLQAQPNQLAIGLTAPTGKAARRLQDAIREAKAKLAGTLNENDLLGQIPDKASTIHRLLRVIPHRVDFYYHQKRLCPLDVLVVDEASMVDLPLLAKLLSAMPAHARIILLGDRDQLSSVESGFAFGDICDPEKSAHFSGTATGIFKNSSAKNLPGISPSPRVLPLSDCIIDLQENFRFKQDSGIRQLSHAVKAGDADKALQLLEKDSLKEILLKPISSSAELKNAILANKFKGFQDYSQAIKQTDPAAAFGNFNQLRVLCVLKRGPLGVSNVNELVENKLVTENFSRHPLDQSVFAGLAISVTRNNYALNLYNGDIGLILPDKSLENKDLRIFFPDEDKGFRRLHPQRLTDWEPAFALTVHKAQGSEFDEVILILPDKDSPVLTRELIYTAITRARKRVEIWGTAEVLRQAIGKRIERSSGLRDALWGKS